MKKIIPVFLLAFILLSACNLPVGQPTADADEVAARVAATLAAADPTATESQSSDPIPTIGLETATLTATVTETVTPTATDSPDDPKLSLASPDFWFNAASSGDPFGVATNPYSDNAITISNQPSGLNFASKAINLGKRWRLSAFNPTNFYLEGTFKIGSCAGKDNYGLAMRVPTYNDSLGYFVGLSCDGSYIVDRLENEGYGINLISWTQDSHIKSGENQVNRLGVQLINDTFKIYINGSLVREFNDSVIQNKGHVGAYVSARERSNFTVDLQELMVWVQ